MDRLKKQDMCHVAHYLRKTFGRDLTGSGGNWWEFLGGKGVEITMKNDDGRRVEGDLSGRFAPEI